MRKSAGGRACVIALTLGGACGGTAAPPAPAPAPVAAPSAAPMSEADETKRLAYTVDHMPIPAAPFTPGGRNDLPGPKIDVRFRYGGPEGTYVDAYVFMLQKHPYPCPAKCLDSLAADDHQVYMKGAVPAMVKAKMWETLGVTAQDSIAPKAGSPWVSARRVRMFGRRDGKILNATRVAFYYPAFRIEFRSDLPETSKHQAEVDAFIFDLAGRVPP